MVSLSLKGHSQIILSEIIPKIPPFSGDEPPQKGDVTFSVWRFEIRYLQIDLEVSVSHLFQVIRTSVATTIEITTTIEIIISIVVENKFQI